MNFYERMTTNEYTPECRSRSASKDSVFGRRYKCNLPQGHPGDHQGFTLTGAAGFGGYPRWKRKRMNK